MIETAIWSETENMPTGQPTARVFIWYPEIEEGMVGHAAMYIGNYEVGKKFELSLDPASPTGVMATALEQSMGANHVHFNQNYVSWWPSQEDDVPGAGPTNRVVAKPMLGLYADVDAEGSSPHVVYDCYGLNVSAMRSCWDQTRTKKDTTYQLIRKNCAGIVARVLKAGGAHTHLGFFTRMWFAHRLIWTPKKVAMICNELRDKDLAIKTKAGNCPEKDSALLSMAGLR